jgi:Xaa-Pro aminopeptidase
MLVSEPANIAYLSGSWKIEGYLLISETCEPKFFTNPIYTQEVKKIFGFTPIITGLGESILSLVAKHLSSYRGKRVGFESRHISYSEYKAISSYLINKNIELVPSVGVLENLRLIKDKNEIVKIKKSISISLEAFSYAKEIRSEKMSEKDLAIEIDKFLRLKGDDELAFKTIVAAAQNAALPHHTPGEDTLDKKNVLIDLGSKYYGYCADLTRVLICSKMPLLFRKMYDTLLKAQSAAIRKIRPGAKVSDVDKAARQVIEKCGWGKNFVHGLGHGIGLSVHEEPFIGPKNKNCLQEGMVVTIEPAIYIQNKIGFRIEDMVLVTSSNAEVLSSNGNR